MEGPPIWQRLLGALAYLLPLSDALRFGQALFDMFPLLGWLALPALPFPRYPDERMTEKCDES